MSAEKGTEYTTSATHAGCLAHDDHDRSFADFDLLSPLTIRGLCLRNRIAVSPMCQYSAKEGFADDWHLVHLGSRAVGGAGLIFTEATAVTAQGRISPGDLGLWDDAHIEPLERITHFIHRMDAKAGIQLAHAGRKGSCDVPWKGGESLSKGQGGWDLVAPSPIPFLDLMPQDLDKPGIQRVIQAFREAAIRAVKAGYDIIEIHSAHGYLLHEFLSPLSNKRTDEYGGSLENRMRLVCQIAQAIRSVIPQQMPLFVRLSATDWVEGGWEIQQSIELAKQLKPLGVDLIDVSSGGSVKHAKIPVGRNYQVPFAAAIREQAQILTGAVGLITDPQQANEIVTAGQADLVFIGREFLREPYWGLKAEQALNKEPKWPMQYGYAVKRHG
ncbi:NADH:flavin oxidoreductase/NADH oxidase [Candidatus Protochlamydia phocaeensis]|uniref:NADH:flavin oxidoreductase/NADH oxidase n=1 Tax=Candidatus Protochlamydia phocaeensis TaxID=1414722 RepID=UPI000837F929|nr:NADH:flavin oxidoreductase/NADH oxidase [Candidatus Protochlamydia phocaeensis]